MLYVNIAYFFGNINTRFALIKVVYYFKSYYSSTYQALKNQYKCY